MVQLSCFQMFNVPLDGIVNPHIFGGQSMKGNFQTIVYLTKANLSIYGSRIETKKLLSILGILINVNLV